MFAIQDFDDIIEIGKKLVQQIMNPASSEDAEMQRRLFCAEELKPYQTELGDFIHACIACNVSRDEADAVQQRLQTEFGWFAGKGRPLGPFDRLVARAHGKRWPLKNHQSKA